MPKFANLDEFYASLPADQEKAIRRFVHHVAKANPELELVVAWNQPMFKRGSKYITGFMPTKNHINLLTVSDSAITHFAARLTGFRHGTRTVALPFDWPVDAGLIAEIIAYREAETQ